jgi:hypothetical protein
VQTCEEENIHSTALLEFDLQSKRFGDHNNLENDTVTVYFSN